MENRETSDTDEKTEANNAATAETKIVEEDQRSVIEKNLLELQELANECDTLLNNPDKLIEIYFDNLRDQVEKQKQRLIDQVNEQHARDIENLRIQEANSKSAG